MTSRAALGAANDGVAADEVLLAQVMDLTGPLATLTADIANATKACFDEINARGGIHGRKLRLLTVDDGYVPANTLRAVTDLIQKEKVFALLNLTGTANVAAVLGRLETESPPVPLVGMITGAQTLRVPQRRNVFHLRASYADEAAKLVEHLQTTSVKRISVLYLDNGFGTDGLAGVQAAMSSRGLTPQGVVAVKPDGSDVGLAVDELLKIQQDAIIMVTTGKASFDFIRQYNGRRKGTQFYTLSVMGAQAAVRALGADGVGVVVTSVVPFPWNRASALASDYRNTVTRAGFPEISFTGMEAFINARVVAEGIRRAGRNLSRDRFLEALESMRPFDLGGHEIAFGTKQREGSRFVELTMIGPNGRFMR